VVLDRFQLSAYGSVNQALPTKSRNPRLVVLTVVPDQGKSEHTKTDIPSALRGAMQLPRVLLADDHTLLLDVFRQLLKPHYDVVGTVSDGSALLESALLLKPDVVVLDIAMPLLNGLDAGRLLKQKMPRIKLIFLTMNEDADLAAAAMQAGACAYLLKTSACSELFHAIEEALKGRHYVTRQIARGMRESFIRDPLQRCKLRFSPLASAR
jgi:DNA-binding NarL/FixJ family response regulator